MHTKQESRETFAVDRIEEGYLICIRDRDEQVFTLEPGTLPALQPAGVFSAVVCGDTLTDILPMPEETARRKEEAKARLKRLFGKS